MVDVDIERQRRTRIKKCKNSKLGNKILMAKTPDYDG